MDRRTFMSGLARNLVAGSLLAQGGIASAAGADALATLAPGSARRLGPYANPAFAEGDAITDYSSITLDAEGGRMLLFGGGHGPSQETDIRALDLATLRWSSLYAPTPVREMTRANCDPDLGRYRSTNQPTARHSYNLTLVRGRRFYMLCYRGMPDHLDGVLGAGNGWGGRICWYDFDAREWSYSRIPEAETPWYFASAAALDPASGRIVVAGPNAQAGQGALWVYDPDADAIARGPALDVGYSHDLVYHPPSDRFIALQSDGRVWEIALDRDALEASRVTDIRVTGAPPQAKVGIVCGYAFDAARGVIGGNVIDGSFHAYDPATHAWTRVRIEVEHGSGGTPAQAYHCLEFDPASGCYVFLSMPRYGSGRAATTWAYRPRAAGASRARGAGEGVRYHGSFDDRAQRDT
jgi:hypothetical protein